MFGASEIELEIMRLLQPEGGLYGLELVKASDKLKRGTIYVYLSRMEDKKWIRSVSEKLATIPGLPRRRYWVTDDGKRVYDRATEMRRQYEAWA